jgi:putative FmdB family regulatory protein
MPTYDYHCDDCDYTFEEKQSFKDEPLKVCPKCEKETLYKLITIPHISIMKDSNTLTLQHLAYRNGKKFSEDQKHSIDPIGYEETKERQNKKENPPPWGAPPKKLYSATAEQRQRYIETGEI